ncbi:MAG: H-NS histone family protein [Hyphomonadaceae bacterium]
MAVPSRRQSSRLPKIDHLTADELTTLIEQSQHQLSKRREESKTKVLAEMRLVADKAGIDFDDLVGKRKPGLMKTQNVRVTMKPKYIGPNGETYAGKGPVPKWLKTLERKGVNREKFRVKGA